MSNRRKGKTVANSSPLTFKAGGKKNVPPSLSSAVHKTKENTRGGAMQCRQPSSNSRKKHPPLPSSNGVLSIIQTGLSAKRSPFEVKNWIACVLTLDGRDKLTKVFQYSSRFLCWYFAGLAKRTTAGIGSSPGDGAGSAVVGVASVLAALSTNLELRRQYYSALSKRFEALYKSLLFSRKAFRLGRSIIEWDKISSMGWGEYLGYTLLHPLSEGVGDNGAENEDATEQMREENTIPISTLARYDTHPIQEEEEVSSDDNDNESSWNIDEESVTDEDEDGLPREEKKIDVTFPSSSTKVKVVSRLGRPKLPSKISSNIGGGASTTTTPSKSATLSTIPWKKQSPSKPPNNTPLTRTVSEMGRQMYQPFPSRSSSMGSYNQAKEQITTASTAAIEKPLISSPATTPSWKLIGGTMKLLGLMGFWAFDNVAFLTGSGFLDPMHGAGGIIIDPKASDRMKRKKRASEWGARCYFIGGMGGLYVNARALWEHRNGLLKQARRKLDEAVLISTNVIDDDGSIDEAKGNLKQAEKKHFVLSLALLKSCCDFMVFSNNPGIDLHLKYRGKKNHEGLHCLGGLISASTVLYSNFANSK